MRAGVAVSIVIVGVMGIDLRTVFPAVLRLLPSEA